jgi:hypothetical protein
VTHKNSHQTAIYEKHAELQRKHAVDGNLALDVDGWLWTYLRCVVIKWVYWNDCHKTKLRQAFMSAV